MLQRGIYAFLFLLWFLMALFFACRESLLPDWEPSEAQARSIRYFYIGAFVFAFWNLLKFRNAWHREQHRANVAEEYARRIGPLAEKKPMPFRDGD